VRSGVWQDQVLPGETRFYRVPVDWGQQAAVFADFAGVQGGAAGRSASVGAGVRLRAYSPVRKFIAGDDHAYDGRPVVGAVSALLAPVSWTNRTASDPQVSAVRFAGWYYFAVSVHPKVAQMIGHGRPLAVTLRIDVRGTPQQGPAYAGDPARAGIGVSAHDVTAADGSPSRPTATASSPAGGGSPGLRALGFSALGTGTVLLAGLGVWTALARRGAGPPRG
jgi:hypothetical protein